MEAAVERQLADLEAANLLTARHSIIVALIRELAGVIGQGAGRGRASAVAMASKELREALAMLPDDPGPEDPLAKLDAELAQAEAAAIERHRASS